MARYVALTGNLDAVDQIFDTIALVAPADIQAAARKFLTDARLTVATVKGVKSATRAHPAHRWPCSWRSAPPCPARPGPPRPRTTGRRS